MKKKDAESHLDDEGSRHPVSSLTSAETELATDIQDRSFPFYSRRGQLPRERDFTSKYPRFSVGTLQPLQADWKGRPQSFFLFLASVQHPLFGLPQGKNPQVPI